MNTKVPFCVTVFRDFQIHKCTFATPHNIEYGERCNETEMPGKSSNSKVLELLRSGIITRDTVIVTTTIAVLIGVLTGGTGLQNVPS